MSASGFSSCELLQGVREARRLRCTVEDEAEPYKSKYAAAELLESLQHKAAALGLETEAALCKLELGLVLLETDLTCQGQQCLEDGLEHAWPAEPAALAVQQQAHNALAALLCDREEFQAALKHLDAATQLYNRIQQARPQAAPEQPAGSCDADDGEAGGRAAAMPHSPCRDASSSSEEGTWQAGLCDLRGCEEHHTTTLYYMAQVHGHAGDKQQSAAYCAATLNRQLRQGGFNINDWVQNCLQLSGWFLDCNTFALSHYCCAAVEQLLVQQQEQLLVQQQEQQGKQAAGKPAGAAADAAPDLQHCSDQRELEPESEVVSSSASAQQQQLAQPQQEGSCSKDQADKQQQPLVPGGALSHARLGPALQQLEQDVAANVALAVAKLHLYCLQSSHERWVEGKQLQYGFSSPADVPAVVCFDALPGLPELRSLRWGDDALAADAGSALELFRAALPWFKTALAHYRLDGWVTEHCTILFEMSNLYRCLAGFEGDPHKACVMHRARAKLLQPLEGQLSPRHFPGLSRSVSLELGNIFREIGDIKAAAGREADKVAAALAAAARHYQLFLDSFAGPDGGGPPAKVEADMEQHYLAGLASLGRVLPRVAEAGPPGQRGATLLRAAGLLERLVLYVGNNGISGRQEEAELAREMAQLLREQVALQQRLAASA